jgi:hypothetical protein
MSCNCSKCMLLIVRLQLSVCVSHVTQIISNATAHAHAHTHTHTHAHTHSLEKLQGIFIVCVPECWLQSVTIRQVLRPTGRPSQHRLVFLVFRYVQANAEMAAKIPSCHCMLLVQPTMFKLTKINSRALKLRKGNLLSKLDA